MTIKKIALGSDHAGWKLKDRLARFLKRDSSLRVRDLGVYSDKERADYPDFARPVARAVADKRADLGLLCCGSGIGMSIAANKTAGVRAAVVWDKKSARLAREHNDANVLCLGGRLLSATKALGCLKSFLETTPSQEPRHKKRIQKIRKWEDKR